MSWHPTKLSEFLNERVGRIKYEEANRLGLQRIKKIDFSGAIHLDTETDTKTNMIRVKTGDLVISGINAAKGAIAVYEGDDDVLATIHYSSYEFDPDQISVDFLKWFFRSSEFSELLKEQIPGGIKTELKPKHILPLRVSLPKLIEQITIAKRLNEVRVEQLKLNHEITHQQALLGKLKQAILQEAIQGKLTADWRTANPVGDLSTEASAKVEPASELLQRIQAEKARLIAEKKIRKEKPLPEITPEEITFEIPDGWEWCRLGEIINRTESGWSPKCLDNPAPEGTWGVLKTTAVQIGEYVESENKKLPARLEPRPKHETKVGDILITRAGPSNRVGICAYVRATRDKLMISDKIIRFHPIIMNGLYIELFANTSLFQKLIEDSKQGMAQSQVNISQDNLKRTAIPLPPLAEQAAIVERVEALMATCRELEAEIERSRTHAADLLQAVLKEAFSPATNEL
ncbi:MAG: restriction endonuclease subunit S [Verrucomicrobiota bacterium]